MNIAVRYYSRGGNTKRLAEAIAKVANVEAKACPEPVEEAVDVLFLGGSVYGFGLDDNLKSYIDNLDPSKIKAAAVFGTSAIVKTGNKEISNLLSKRGIKVMDENFHCSGAFALLHRGHPNNSDIKNAEAFAEAVVSGLE